MNTSILPQEQKKLIKVWRKLDQSLSKKYGTKENRLSFKKIGFIRQSFNALGLTKKQTIKRAESFAYRERNKRRHKIVWYLYIATFLKNCSDEVWQEINQEVKKETL